MFLYFLYVQITLRFSLISGDMNATTYTTISMGVVISVVTIVLVIVIVLLLKSKAKVRKLLSERNITEKMQQIVLYEDIDISQVIDPTVNVAYEAPPSKP